MSQPLFDKSYWVPNFWGRYVVYFRVSQAPRSGLHLAEQREVAQQILGNGKCKAIEEFVEDEDLCDGNRPKLSAALDLCREKGAKLLIAKIGRLHRNVRLLEILRSSGVKFVAGDMPQVNHLNTHQLIWREQDRRKRISLRVRDSLAEAKLRGVRLGRFAGTRDALKLGPAASAVSRRKRAIERAIVLQRHIESIKAGRDLSLREIARGLNERGVRAPRGGGWSASQVRAALRWCQDSEE